MPRSCTGWSVARAPYSAAITHDDVKRGARRDSKAGRRGDRARQERPTAEWQAAGAASPARLVRSTAAWGSGPPSALDADTRKPLHKGIKRNQLGTRPVPHGSQSGTELGLFAG